MSLDKRELFRATCGVCHRSLQEATTPEAALAEASRFKWLAIDDGELCCNTCLDHAADLLRSGLAIKILTHLGFEGKKSAKKKTIDDIPF